MNEEDLTIGFLVGHIFQNADFIAHDVGIFFRQAAVYQIVEHQLHGPAALLMRVLVEGGLD